MKHSRYLMLIFAASALTLTLAAPQAVAGGRVSLHAGNMGFGLSVGYGDWGVYTNAWAEPNWNLSYDDALSGYGEWVWVTGLGRVWRPWVAGSWRPFTHGRWVFTNLGWTWVAYEPWGYLPHHYGQWAFSSYGWVWSPGYTYQAANVVWVGSGAYVGWYAAPPRGWSHANRGFVHGYNRGYRDGYRDAQYATYVPWRNMGADNISRHAVSRSAVSRDRMETLAAAPTTRDVLQRGGVRFDETRLSTRTVRTGGHQITIARPDGVTRSIERNAGPTVERVLSDAARVRRQPTARTRSSSSPSAPRSTAQPARSLSTRSRSATGSRRQTASVQPPTRATGSTADRRISEPQRSQSAASDRSVVRRRHEAQSPRQSTTSRPTAPASRRATTTSRNRATASQSSARSQAAHNRRATENAQHRTPSRQSAARSRSSKDETDKEAPRSNRRSGRSRVRQR